MNRSIGIGPGIVALALIAAPATALAQDAAAPAVAAPKLDPVAIDALRNMGAYLKTLKSFEIKSNATIETNVEDTDIKVTLGFQNLYRVQRPNAFFVEVRSDRQFRQYFYDGKSFTVSVPRQNFYSTVAAPATIAAVVDDIYAQYDIVMPLSDIFAWSDAGAPTDGLETALRIGYARIDGTDTDQFAYRGPLLDMQIWIARGPKPLPMKIVLTARDDPTRSSYSAELSWNTAASFPAATFAFKPDAKASAIQLARASTGEN